jgi:hypothetical protein
MNLLEELQNAAVVTHMASNLTAAILCNKHHKHAACCTGTMDTYTHTEKGATGFIPCERKIK